MPSLPGPHIIQPTCGACGDDLSHDGETYFCAPCGLDYGETIRGDEPAVFRDDVDVCGSPCINRFHQEDGGVVHSNGRRQRWVCHPCALPVGHTSSHWSGCSLQPETV